MKVRNEMDKATSKAIAKYVEKSLRVNNSCNCCNLRGGCSALIDSEFVKNCLDGTCGTIKCPFYKPDENLIRVGNTFMTTEQFKKYQNTTITVKWLNKRLDDLDNYALSKLINLDNEDYERGVRAGISYATEYLTKQMKKVKMEKNK